MSSQKIQALCFGVFLLPALTSSGAALLIDDFSIRQGNASVYALAGESMESAEAIDSGTIAGNRMTYVSASADTTAGVYSQTWVDSGFAKFYRDNRTYAGSSTHTISWTAATAYNLLSLTGASSIADLTFALDVNGRVGQLLTVQLGDVVNNATFSAVVSDAGILTLTHTGSSGTPNLSAVTQISLSATIPFGRTANVNLSFNDLNAVGVFSPVPEPSEWA